MTHSHDDPKRKDLVPVRRALAQKKGREYWRSLNELANSEDFEQVIKQEFPRQAGLLGTLPRRDFLKVLGASLALAGLTACVPQQGERILPYAKPPEQLVPGKPLFYASSLVMDGYARGVLVKTSMNRPIKLEGNPNHPESQGASDAFMQASILELYNPDRVKQVLNGGTTKTWADFTGALGGILGGAGQGAGLRIVTGPVSSPSLAAQMTDLLDRYPDAKWVQYSPVGRGNSSTAARAAFDDAAEAIYDFAAADVILSLDCDFLFSEPGSLRYSRDFSKRHQPISANGTMNRLYMVESSATVTGANADHRLAVKPSQVEAFARAIASRLGVDTPAPTGDVPGQAWLDAIVEDLRRAGRAALVVVGERQPAAVHALALAMNQALGSMNNTVRMMNPVLFNAGDGTAGLKALVDELNAGAVTTLVILDGNPVYTAPVDLNFGEAMKKAATSISLAYYPDETAALATWVIPAAHELEAWGDARAYDGTVSIIQPVIEPLFGGKSALEVAAALNGQAEAKGYDLVRGFWQNQIDEKDFENGWKDILANGIYPDSASKPLMTTPAVPAAAFAAQQGAANGLEIVFEPDHTIWDGRYANNAWLQELPKPLTKLTWDNAAFMSPKTASDLGIPSEAFNPSKDGDYTTEVVTLKLRGRSVDAPVYVQPGQPDGVIVVSLGYGRTAGGSVLAGAGFNANAIRTTEAPWFDSGLEVTRTGRTYTLATTHEHWLVEGRDLLRSGTLDEYQKNPEFAKDEEILQTPTLYGEEEYPTYAWGMSINLNTCIGCSACVVACQAENNIPTVGKDQVVRGREMHWLRIDRYFVGPKEKPRYAFMPVPCMHCEKAPCEPVCPVEATSHSAEGINEMTYNRCVGTRYCSNNCPYKVRRFNFFKYVDDKTEILKAMRNPDVTVRSRGVMEKCTYCVQRVTQARVQAEIEGRRIEDGEVKTACQQACPTDAIIFGDISQKESAVSKLKENPLNYGLLAELGTQPRTTYLAQVKNPNPAIQEA